MKLKKNLKIHKKKDKKFIAKPSLTKRIDHEPCNLMPKPC
jgi:hypothetical protein